MSVRSSAIGLATVVVLMGAGAAQSLTGSNTVLGDDIVDGTITHADVKTNSIGGSRLLDNAVTGGKILDSTVTGADVNESTLVPTCPTDMARVADVCYGPPRTTNNQFFAHFDCVDEHLRLPSIPEALMVTTTTGGTIWTDEISSGPIYAVSNSYATDGNPHPYRCVTTVGARP